MANDLKYYMQLPYTVVLKPDEDGDYVARIDELEGCIAHGETPEAAFALSNEVKELWITDALQRGDAIPEPGIDEELPSGRWVQRVPRALHKQLVELAKKERTSLNTFLRNRFSGCGLFSYSSIENGKEGSGEPLSTGPANSVWRSNLQSTARDERILHEVAGFGVPRQTQHWAEVTNDEREKRAIYQT